MSDPIKACTDCINPDYKWPSINDPGLPTMVAGTIGASLAIILYIKKYIPPKPTNPPSIPSVSIFVDAFTAAAPGMPAFDSFELDVPGVPKITIPGGGGTKIDTPGWKPGFPKMMELGIAMPYLLCVGIVKDLLNLKVQMPGYDLVVDKIGTVGLAVGLPAKTIATFAPCLAKSVISVLKV